LLANLQYAGSNNSQHLDPYALLSLGASHVLGVGKLSFLETNVFNTESGAFSSLAYAQPLATSGGGSLYIAANPNPPRQFTLTYSFNTGALAGAGGARPSRTAARAAAAQAAQNLANGPQQQQRARGLGAFTPFPPPAGVDPLTVAEKRDSCTADDAKIAAPVLEQLRAAAGAYAAGKPLPAVDGLALVAHGDPSSSWYFEVRPNLPPRPAGSGERSTRSARFGMPAGAGGIEPGGGGPGPGEPPGGPGPGGPAPLVPAPSASGPENGSSPATPSPAASSGPSPGASLPAAGPSAPQRLVVEPRANPSPRPRPSPDPAIRAAFAKFRATLSCSYFSALTQTEAKDDGFAVFIGRNGLGYAPRIGLFAVRAPELGTGGGSLKHQ
jgi:hypothetical protein